MKTKIALLLSLIVFITCSKEHGSIDNKRGLSYADFENNLKSDMNYNSITAKFGISSKDLGSGIHIYVYELIDSSEVWIGYTGKILYAKHFDVNHVLLEDLIK